jgi:two-component system chemotaxis response regulator CheY
MADVLVVDDSPFYRRLIPAIVEGTHDVVGTAESGVEAVDRHEALDPDVVLMGWSLPIRDGVVAAEEITAAAGDTSVVLFGETPDPETRREAEAVGVREYLVTPFRRRGVLDAIGRTRNKPT